MGQNDTIMQVPFFSFRQFNAPLKQQYLAAVAELMENGQFILGDTVRQFENNFAAYCGAGYCRGVANGTDALVICLKALGVGPGHEVIVPGHTFIATWLAVTHCGATPVPVDADAATSNINTALIEESITAKTKALIPVHLYGRPCDMPAVMGIAAKHGLAVIEDFAQAHGAALNGKKTGTFGAINATSFYPSKNLGAFGDAGAVTTNSAELAEKATALRNLGQVKKYEHIAPGLNSRLDSMQAALLNIKLSMLNAWNDMRIKAAEKYNTLLKGLEKIQLPLATGNETHVYHLYVIQTPDRDGLQQYLAERGISTQVHYPRPPHLQKLYTGNYNLPVTEKLAGTVLSLPLFPGITGEEIEYVCANLIAYYR